MKIECPECQSIDLSINIESGGVTCQDCRYYWKDPIIPHLVIAAPEMLEALHRAVPWLGKLIADKGHLQSVLPNDAVRALQMAEAAIIKAEGK